MHNDNYCKKYTYTNTKNIIKKIILSYRQVYIIYPSILIYIHEFIKLISIFLTNELQYVAISIEYRTRIKQIK